MTGRSARELNGKINYDFWTSKLSVEYKWMDYRDHLNPSEMIFTRFFQGSKVLANAFEIGAIEQLVTAVSAAFKATANEYMCTSTHEYQSGRFRI